MHMRQITIREVLNGFHVTVDCQELVFPDFDTLLKELVAYNVDPEGVEKKYIELMQQKNPQPVDPVAMDTARAYTAEQAERPAEGLLAGGGGRARLRR